MSSMSQKLLDHYYKTLCRIAAIHLDCEQGLISTNDAVFQIGEVLQVSRKEGWRLSEQGRVEAKDQEHGS